MHVLGLLHNFVKKSCVGVHSKRLKTVCKVVESLMFGGKLTIAGLGRSLKTGAKTKHNIKRADRLVGNKKLHKERFEFYKNAANCIISDTKKPLLIIDWSSLPDPNFYLLRASVPTHGRAMTIYEEIHPKKKLNNHRIHKLFLNKLKSLVPEGCRPITVTDAGFHSPFFREVEQLDWNWVGRIRNLTKYRGLTSDIWFHCKKLYKKATRIPKFIDEVVLSKSTPIQCSLFLFKDKKKGRIDKNQSGKRRRNKASKDLAKTNKEPWVLATSLKGGNKIAKNIVRIYKARMQIEEGFRDIKNSRFGFGFEETLTHDAKRLENLLLIGMLAILVTTLLGKAGERRRLQFDYQANTIRNRTVLSAFFLGCQILRKGQIDFSKNELDQALKELISSLNKWEDINLC